MLHRGTECSYGRYFPRNRFMAPCLFSSGEGRRGRGWVKRDHHFLQIGWVSAGAQARRSASRERMHVRHISTCKGILTGDACGKLYVIVKLRMIVDRYPTCLSPAYRAAHWIGNGGRRQPCHVSMSASFFDTSPLCSLAIYGE